MRKRRNQWSYLVNWILIFGIWTAYSVQGQGKDVVPPGDEEGTPSTELTPSPIQSIILISTLDGSLTAIDRLTGEQRWTTKDEPLIRVPSSTADHLKPPYFLPDPRSGSLYVLGGQGQLKKLPFTIPQLVSMAPCKSSEGLLYTGRKMDMWLNLNPLTGEKSEIVSFEENETQTETCPASLQKENLLIGKSEYTISMLDAGRKWNVTFHDYASVDMTKEVAGDYDLVHFTSPSTGSILTYERNSGSLLWTTELKSPVIALYSIDCKMSNLISIPFTTVASETLNRIKTPSRADNTLLPTLYIGQCPYGLYAVPSLVDDTVLTISTSSGSGGSPYLIEGPVGGPGSPPGPTPNIAQSTPAEVKNDFVILGHYDVPEQPIQHQITDQSNDTGKIITSPAEEYPEAFPPPGVGPGDTTSNTFPPPAPQKPNSSSKEPILVLTTAIITIAITSTVMSIGFFTFRKFQWKKVKYLSGTEMTIGKITLDPSAVLGKGCEGTFVFKGKFEGRDVAVKRILPECFQFADREVDLLKESDQHANVVRYFCTEEDGQFRYIALELCSATLSDWIEGKFVHPEVQPMTVLKEATDGLAYLHSLRIVHRDIKPQNVLLSVCPTTNSIRTMISDFGLCKKLAYGRVSFSRKSGGIPGTEGWIAPEMMRMKERTTHSVDIFSLGCVYYYVLTNGAHPFGDPFRRQSNIISGQNTLQKLNSTSGANELVARMISHDPNSRPPIAAVLSHPIFWSNEKVLGFFLDISDRIEKESVDDCTILKRLEADSFKVVRGDWRDHICNEVAMDLRKYRTYKGNSVRDLLRALRNKKNHYRELTPEAQASLGQIPEEFVHYWLSRFNNLLPYTWESFESIKAEPIFTKYYNPNFNWTTWADDALAEREPEDGLGSPSLWPPEPKQPTENGIGPMGMGMGVGNSPQGERKLDKNFWKSKTQQKYNKWRRQIHHNSVHPELGERAPRFFK